jgi:hypothetical protein
MATAPSQLAQAGPAEREFELSFVQPVSIQILEILVTELLKFLKLDGLAICFKRHFRVKQTLYVVNLSAADITG